jgi:hypothetical protein
MFGKRFPLRNTSGSINNVNRLANNQMELLDLIQDTAKVAQDERIATIVFVSSEGRIQSRMQGNFILFVVLFVNHYVLIHCYR